MKLENRVEQWKELCYSGPEQEDLQKQDVEGRIQNVGYGSCQ